ncbi:MAG: hypothetical protein AAGF75_12505, partial [Cyanobacteria bacterium P01_H01_bin.130]
GLQQTPRGDRPSPPKPTASATNGRPRALPKPTPVMPPPRLPIPFPISPPEEGPPADNADSDNA